MSDDDECCGLNVTNVEDEKQFVKLCCATAAPPEYPEKQPEVVKYQIFRLNVIFIMFCLLFMQEYERV